MKLPSPKAPTLPAQHAHGRAPAPVAALGDQHAAAAAVAKPQRQRGAAAPARPQPPAGEPDQRAAQRAPAAHADTEAEAGQGAGHDPPGPDADVDEGRVRARRPAVGPEAAAPGHDGHCHAPAAGARPDPQAGAAWEGEGVAAADAHVVAVRVVEARDEHLRVGAEDERAAAAAARLVGQLEAFLRRIEAPALRHAGHGLRIGPREDLELGALDVGADGGFARVVDHRLGAAGAARGRVGALAVVPVEPARHVAVRVLLDPLDLAEVVGGAELGHQVGVAGARRLGVGVLEGQRLERLTRAGLLVVLGARLGTVLEAVDVEAHAGAGADRGDVRLRAVVEEHVWLPPHKPPRVDAADALVDAARERRELGLVEDGAADVVGAGLPAGARPGLVEDVVAEVVRLRAEAPRDVAPGVRVAVLEPDSAGA